MRYTLPPNRGFGRNEMTCSLVAICAVIDQHGLVDSRIEERQMAETG
jgi:hypothetical protein